MLNYMYTVNEVSVPVQGIQRRIRVRLFYEADAELFWSRVNEIVIGII